MRQHHKLDEIEYKRWRKLKPVPHVAMDFWHKVAFVRGLDPLTVISDAPSFSALPLGHGKHWCFPSALRCKRKPIYKEPTNE